MSSSSWAYSGVLVLLFAAGCSAKASAPPDLAINGSPPALTNRVGPLPGPAEQAPELKNPFEGDTTAAQQGYVLFNQFNCSGCHGGHAGGGMGPSLRDGAWIYGNTDRDLYGAIVDGRGHGMPAWGSRIPDPLVWQLVSYIRTLGTSTEPQAPSQIVPPPPS